MARDPRGSRKQDVGRIEGGRAGEMIRGVSQTAAPNEIRRVPPVFERTSGLGLEELARDADRFLVVQGLVTIARMMRTLRSSGASSVARRMTFEAAWCLPRLLRIDA